MKRTEIACLLAFGLMINSLGGAASAKSDISAPKHVQALKTASTSTTTAITTTPGGITTPPAIDDDDNKNDDKNVITPANPTITIPTAPSVSSIKGGNKRIKLYWSKMPEATGYKIYYSTSKNGSYKRLKTITNKSTVSYLKTGLKQNKKYYFKLTSYVTKNGLTLESTYSPVVSAKTCAVSSTSKNPKYYLTKSKFFKSPAYKKYTALSKKSAYSKSFAIPGVKNTNVGGFASTSMLPQGMCQAGGYILISAYDTSKRDESVIYVMSRSSHSYITTIVLPSKAKVESMAYDGKNIWISKGSNVAYFPYSVITTAASKGSSYYILDKYTGYLPVKTNVGVMTCYNNVLWIGKSGSASSSKMYGYTITTSKGKCTLTQKYSMTIPARTQGITFDSKGYLYLTRSNKTNPKAAKYMSCIQTFKPSLASPTAKGAIKKGKVINKLTLPPRAEGVTVYGKYLYTLYSSCQYSASKYPVDRVIATKLTKLK